MHHVSRFKHQIEPLYAEMLLLYRSRQFFAAIRASISADERRLVAELLSPGELRLFETMPLYDQRHCFDVFATLRDAGHNDPLLLRAALIHDCGKVDDQGRVMTLPWYVAASVLKSATPGLYSALAASGRGLLRPLRIYAEHAWRGSQLAAAAGSSPAIVDTIRHYHDADPTGCAAILQWADEQH